MFLLNSNDKDGSIYGVNSYNPFFLLLPIIMEHIEEKKSQAKNLSKNSSQDCENDINGSDQRPRQYMSVFDLVNHSKYYE